MKNKINKKDLVLKQRRKWNINPVTRIEDSKKVYNRSTEKLITQSEIQEELDEYYEQDFERDVVNDQSKD